MSLFTVYYSNFKRLGDYKTLDSAIDATKSLPVTKSWFILETTKEGTYTMSSSWGNILSKKYYQGACKLLVDIKKDNCNSFEFSRHFIHPGEVTVIDTLGKGSQATVYKAVYNNEDVAIRFLHGSTISNMLDVEKRELDISAELRHKNVIKVIGFTTGEDEEIGIITSLYTEGDLTNFLSKNKNVNTIDLLSLIIDVAKGIRYLHENNIIHRDIKPENILVTKENDKIYAILSDLGTARIMESINKKMTIVGTPYFMAPEVYDGKYDSSIDIFSLGITLREIFKEHKLLITSDINCIIEECIDKVPSKRPSIDVFIEKMLKITSF